jgi:hypothetical protein
VLCQTLFYLNAKRARHDLEKKNSWETCIRGHVFDPNVEKGPLFRLYKIGPVFFKMKQLLAPVFV